MTNYPVMPAEAGIQFNVTRALRLEAYLDPGLRRGDAEAMESSAK